MHADCLPLPETKLRAKLIPSSAWSDLGADG